MAKNFATYNFKEVFRGDAVNAKAFQVIVNGAPSNLTGATIRMEFRFANQRGPVSYLATTENDGITITNPSNGEFTVESFIADMIPGIHFYDIEITYSPTVVKTYIKGQIRVKQDVTQEQNG